MEYKNCIFDLYGTLVDIHTEEEGEPLWEKLALFYGYYGAAYTGKELHDAYRRLAAEEEGHLKSAGAAAQVEIALENVFLALFSERGVCADRTLAIHAGQFLRVLSTEYVRLYPGVKELLQTLHAAGKRVILLSNAQQIFTEYEIKMLGIYDCFDAVYLSSDYGCKKPDAHFFKQMLEKEGISPAESIMIGNDPFCDVAGAKAVGLATLFLPSNLSPESEGTAGADYMVENVDMEKVAAILLQN